MSRAHDVAATRVMFRRRYPLSAVTLALGLEQWTVARLIKSDFVRIFRRDTQSGPMYVSFQEVIFLSTLAWLRSQGFSIQMMRKMSAELRVMNQVMSNPLYPGAAVLIHAKKPEIIAFGCDVNTFHPCRAHLIHYELLFLSVKERMRLHELDPVRFDPEDVRE